jgi:tetratricopeptide (TPR) repeat protein
MSTGQQDFQSLVLSCNKDGMNALRKGQHKAAFEQFKYAEAILIANQAEGDHTSLLAVTCNNLGCYYKKVGKPHGALSYLRRALKMEVELNTHEVTLAGTHLNICAILSKLEKHDKAVQHALNALELIDSLVSKSDPEKVSQDDYSVLAIAYHNVAVERDFLHQYDKAAAAFQQGYQVAKRCLGEDHPLSKTLGMNCDAVLQKTQKVSKTAVPSLVGSHRLMKEPLTKIDSLPALPEVKDIPSTQAPDEIAKMPLVSPVHKDAAMWMEAEEQAWHQFAQSALNVGENTASPIPKRSLQPIDQKEKHFKPPSQVSATEPAAYVKDVAIPSFQDTRNYRNGMPSDTPATRSITQLVPKTPLAQALDDHPEAMMDLIEGDMQGGSIRMAPNDFRPNRVIKGCTRTFRVVRRTGMFTSTKHRDHIMTNLIQKKGPQQKSEYVRKAAAEKIQRVWRAWFKYCQENADWMTTTGICATMIQSKWRSYHVQRLKLDRAARTIQRHVRGHIVRKVLRRHTAAVTIQRHVIGMLTRAQLRGLHRAAVKMQALVRGGLARKHVRARRALLTMVAGSIQCAVRCLIAKRRVKELRSQRNQQNGRIQAAITIQRSFRGWKGRQRAAARREEYMEALEQHMAATKLQAMYRRDRAAKRVDNIRGGRIAAMGKAATFLRKMWLGSHTRKRYKALTTEFRVHEGKIITIQRYARGFLVRLRMWHEAIRAEEELWAVLEIQRLYRGYCGRVGWETAYEMVWRREMAAVVIQRNMRGWLARTTVGRKRRKIARAEFERARRRFRAAQHIQATARGMLARKIVCAKRQRLVSAAICIQRISRGHSVRWRLWNQVIDMRATMITARVRGFLVRNRRFHLVAKVIFIQRHIRAWQKKPVKFRAEAFANMRIRKAKAAQIQQAFRKHAEKKEINRIQDTSAIA